jgi:hypothetical protein
VGPFLASLFTTTSYQNFFWMNLGTGIFTQVVVFLSPETKYIRHTAVIPEVNEKSRAGSIDEDKKEVAADVEVVHSSVLGRGRRKSRTDTCSSNLVLTGSPSQLDAQPGHGSQSETPVNRLSGGSV